MKINDQDSLLLVIKRSKPDNKLQSNFDPGHGCQYSGHTSDHTLDVNEVWDTTYMYVLGVSLTWEPCLLYDSLQQRNFAIVHAMSPLSERNEWYQYSKLLAKTFFLNMSICDLN